jgi:hypothetical protein
MHINRPVSKNRPEEIIQIQLKTESNINQLLLSYPLNPDFPYPEDRIRP